jgi:hypothetical protein
MPRLSTLTSDVFGAFNNGNVTDDVVENSATHVHFVRYSGWEREREAGNGNRWRKAIAGHSRLEALAKQAVEHPTGPPPAKCEMPNTW